MSVLVAIVLGLVQGLTEFLPVSSSGHLVLLNKIFGIEGDFLLLSILLHLATLFAVIFVFYKEIWNLIKHPFSYEAKSLYIATMPTVIIVFIFKKFLESAFLSGSLLPFCFMFTAVLLFITYIFSKKNNYEFVEKKEISWKSALVMGIAQGIAVLPGISRSGSTICSGLMMGERRKQTAKFSFLMSIPVIIASLFYEIIFSNGETVSQISVLPIIIAVLVAFVVGIFSIKIMLKIVEKAKYYYFSIYLIILSIISLFIV